MAALNRLMLGASSLAIQHWVNWDEERFIEQDIPFKMMINR